MTGKIIINYNCSLFSRLREEREQKLRRKLITTTDEKLHYSSFGWGRSFAIFYAQHLFWVQNYAGKLQKKLADNEPLRQSLT